MTTPSKRIAELEAENAALRVERHALREHVADLSMVLDVIGDMIRLRSPEWAHVRAMAVAAPEIHLRSGGAA